MAFYVCVLAELGALIWRLEASHSDASNGSRVVTHVRKPIYIYVETERRNTGKQCLGTEMCGVTTTKKVDMVTLESVPI